MTFQDHTPPAPGWRGGFEEKNPAFSYPDPDLSSLHMLQNLTHIKLLKRQQGVEWPEFSWQTIPGIEDSRCFQMFSPYVSRLGYDDRGKVYSIICPQQGMWIKGFGTLNVEVTVTGNRGWVNEDTRELAADLTVEPKIWFSPDASQSPLGKFIWDAFEVLAVNWPFPDSKANAIQLTTFDPGNPNQPIFPLRKGISKDFKTPDFTLHADEAWSVANLEVEIGPIKPTTSTFVDDFNQLVMNAFNAASGNMLTNGNTLAWNVWFTEPELVDQKEWADHAEYWRTSIDVNHTAPTGSGTTPKYYDGTPFTVKDALVQTAVKDIVSFITQHLYDHHSQMVH